MMKSHCRYIFWLLAAFCPPSLPLLSAAERVALVIGNNAYQHGTPLKNCVSDARAVAGALKGAGFEVIVAEDAGLEQMEKKVLEFRRAAQGAKAAWFHYSGHGVEVKGSNYLVPVDADVQDEFQVKHKTYALDQMLGAMEESGTPLKVVVLDCCRDNPFGRGWSRSGSTGLAQIADTPSGTIIAFATSPGKVAEDGQGGNSPFTTALVAALGKPGLEIDQVFKETGRAVLASTGNSQQPWINSSFFDSFVMRNIVNGNGGGFANPTATSASASTPNNLPEQMPDRSNLPANKPALSIPVDMPASGFFDSVQVFEETPYAKFNSVSRQKILAMAQEKLKARNLYLGNIDGSMGQGSQKAILEWQVSQGIAPSGRLDLATQSSLGLIGYEEIETPTNFPKMSSSTKHKVTPKPQSREDFSREKAPPKKPNQKAQDLDEQFRRAAQEFESR